MQSDLFSAVTSIWKTAAAKTEGFYTNPFIEINIQQRLLNFFQVGDYYCLIFNIENSSFDFVSEEIEKVLGYKAEEVNVPFFLGLIHPEDAPFFQSFEKTVADFFAMQTPLTMGDYKVRYDYRVKHKDGRYVRILQQYIIIDVDSKNQNFRTLGIHTDITAIKPNGKPVLSIIGLNNNPSFIDVNHQETFKKSESILSPREKEVLVLLMDGMNSREISEKLYISKLTVDTHRKNILKKTGCSNSKQLISKVVKEGIF